MSDLAGFDASIYQGSIDWEKVKAAGVEFVYAKATEGADYTDANFRANHNGAKSVGIPFGAYHFFHAALDPLEQAKHFLSVTNGYQGQLVPMNDFEVNDGIADVSVLTARLSTFNRAIEATLDGKLLLIYTGYAFWNSTMRGSDAFAGHPLAIAEYNSDAEPTLPQGWKKWTIWQRSDNGLIAGIKGDVDLDQSNGKSLAVIER